MTRDTIVKLENSLEAAKWDYLKRFGWAQTCHSPGAYWVWVRDWKAEDEAALENWHHRNAIRLAEIEEHGRAHTPNSPRKPEPYGRVMAGLDMAVSMTRNVLDRDNDDDEED